MNKQCICPTCGRVAEVRRQKNGQRLRYMYCKEGHGGILTRKDSDHWAAIEQDGLGVLGEYPGETPAKEEKQPEPAQVDQTETAETPAPEEKPKQAAKLEPDDSLTLSGDWEPAPENRPESEKPAEVDQTETDDNKFPVPGNVIAGVLLLLVCGVGGVVYANSKGDN